MLPPRAGKKRGSLQLWAQFAEKVPRLSQGAGRASCLKPDQLQPALPRRRRRRRD